MVDTLNSHVHPARSIDGDISRSWLRRLWLALFSAIVLLSLLFGWHNRDNSYLSASDGLGYWLGITGGSLMLLLLLYPLRKSWRLMHGWGPIKYWFQLHMLFGILGPALILFHANFSLGSTNSNLALYSMLIVAGSGIVGRYIYSKIHYGLYGHKASLKELRQDIQITRGNLGEHLTLSSRIVALFKRLEKFSLQQRPFLLHLLLMPYIVMRSYLLLQRIKHAVIHDLKIQARKNHWDAGMLEGFARQSRMHIENYFYCLKKTSQLSLYSRLFSIWHVLHMPLFIMLVITGVIHVMAVHMY